MPSSTSLLDDLYIGKVDEALRLGVGSSMLVPDQVSKKNPNANVKLDFLDDEEWNW